MVVLIGSQRKSDAMLHVPVKNKSSFFNMKKHDTFQTRGPEGGARKAEEVVTFRLGAVAKGRPRAVPGVPLVPFLRQPGNRSSDKLVVVISGRRIPILSRHQGLVLSSMPAAICLLTDGVKLAVQVFL